jgi:hypothetical protein
MRLRDKFMILGLLLPLVGASGCWPSGTIPCATSTQCAGSNGPLDEADSKASFCSIPFPGGEASCVPLLCTIGSVATNAPLGATCVALSTSRAVSHFFELSGTNGYNGYYHKQVCSVTEPCPQGTECKFAYCQPLAPVKN